MAYWTRKGRVRACEAAVLPDLWVTTIGSDGTEIEGLMLSCLWKVHGTSAPATIWTLFIPSWSPSSASVGWRAG
ncbi:hypothetical protein [Novacetimonas hansenii]|uniref:hypothetical protein n=1 Tax=Novacetimonas hansenii TaxID=436 RepID=UPI0023DD231B|nr:hypothetical protein [Novacetimonas hansenii]WEQ60561.1 hypothetical protein LV563_14650 [Novacetimonas hansenii]